LLFAAFIYKLTKNEQQRVYVKNIRAARKAARKEAVEGNAQNGAVSTSESEASGSASPSAVDLASNSSMAASQFPGTGLSPSDAIDLTAVPEQGLLRPLTPPELTYASPQVATLVLSRSGTDIANCSIDISRGCSTGHYKRPGAASSY